ncbi:hypothetical protein HB771_02495 (plasmid) [Rhizobium leguminosarum bv. viciae]|jgi:hypothetical protein|nr:hypothetical protein HB771_02495 [Rhizobium leguminosarum bv. viciae]
MWAKHRGAPAPPHPGLGIAPPERPQLGAYAQAAVISFETAFFAIALLFVAPASILSCRQDHPPQEQRFVISSGEYGSGTFYVGATVPSEDVGERIEHRCGCS